LRLEVSGAKISSIMAILTAVAGAAGWFSFGLHDGIRCSTSDLRVQNSYVIDKCSKYLLSSYEYPYIEGY
jgi:hypothetical protein